MLRRAKREEDMLKLPGTKRDDGRILVMIWDDEHAACAYCTTG